MEELRDQLLRLLDSWEREALQENGVLEAAEDMWDSQEWPELPRSDPRSIEIEALGQLSMLNVQLVCRDDIEEILCFLNTEPGAELAAWDRWDQYWSRIDYKRRAERLRGNDLYLTGEFLS